MMKHLLFLIPLLPLLCAAINAVWGMRLPRRLAETVAVAGVALSFGLTLWLWPLAHGEGTRVTLFTWLDSGSLHVAFGLLFDRLAAPMTLMVTGVSTLIHLYAVGYMEEDADYARFFSLLNLFVFAMLAIVLADNLLLFFLGWEGVGFCSYGLIGFWYREEENALAGRKAFLVTRAADVFLGIAILWCFKLFGTLSIAVINARAAALPIGTVTALALLLLAGACGKSAQFPFMSWLPDAMAGPTPVSALIHAATMVTAGVYLLCRLFPLVSLSPTAMAAIAGVGAFTALYAATCALGQTEIKRVLAYSTMSQVGYMFLAVGAGTVAGAMFHLFVHAFFKALLFMGAGCIMHLLGGEQDIFRMGGLARRAPAVFWTFLAGALCLAGAPLTGGFFSKEGVLMASFADGTPYDRLLWGVGLFTALLTALYTFRLVYLVFAGEPRRTYPEHRLPKLMIWTMVPLAAAALLGGLLNLPPVWGGGEALRHLLGSLSGEIATLSPGLEWALTGLAILFFLVGWLLARRLFLPAPHERPSPLKTFFLRGWEADEIIDRTFVRPFGALADFFWRGTDEAVIDGLVDGTGRSAQGIGSLVRRMTNGKLSTYVAAFAWGLVAMLGWFLLWTLK
jgi:NADH-quinone oxidoreductase subunit L